MIQVEARQLGKRKSLVPEWSFPNPPEFGGDGGDGLTLAQLIERIVRDQVRAFEERQEARKFVRVLSESEVQESQIRGAIKPGGRDLRQPVDSDHAVATALQGFEDGLYLVFIDEVEQTDLEQQVWLAEGSAILFLRLTFLAGG